MRAIDLTPPTVVSADESTSLADAATLMRQQGVGYEQAHLEAAPPEAKAASRAGD
jgi:hypothetical protein